MLSSILPFLCGKICQKNVTQFGSFLHEFFCKNMAFSSKIQNLFESHISGLAKEVYNSFLGQLA